MFALGLKIVYLFSRSLRAVSENFQTSHRQPKLSIRLPFQFIFFNFVNTTRRDFDWSTKTMRLFVGLTNKARGDPWSILVWLSTNQCCPPPSNREIGRSPLWTRLFRICEGKQSRKKAFVSKAFEGRIGYQVN